MMFLFTFVTSIIALTFLWITAIYVYTLHWIAVKLLLYFEVLIFSVMFLYLWSTGCKVGAIDGLFQVTRLLTETEVFTSMGLFDFFVNIVQFIYMFIYTLIYTFYFVVLVVTVIINLRKTLCFLLLYTFLVFFFVLLFSLFNSVQYCEGPEQLPCVIEFNNLHITDVLRNAKESLNDASGIYCVSNQETGQIYIGSSMNLHDRVMDHLIYNCRSNAHLQFAIVKFGLAAFSFKVIELCTKELLLEREQFWLDWLFSLPSHLHYNFSPTAGSPTGSKLSEEAKAKISAAKKGKYTGEQNSKATAVTVVDLEGNILISTPTVSAAAKWIGVPQSTLSTAIKRGTIIRKLYRAHYTNKK